MNKKQLIGAINAYPYLNNRQKDILIYFILISLDIPNIPYSVNTTISHISNVTRMNVNQVWRAIEALKKKKLITEIKAYKNKMYKIEYDEIIKMTIYSQILKRNAKEMQKKYKRNS